MLRGILITVLTITVIGTSYWGYKEHQEKNAVLIQAENNYQRAFHDLTYQVDLLNDKIGGALAMSSRDSLSPTLAEVWRITSEAHTDVSQLPLTLLPFNKTEEFLANVGEFSYRAAVRNLDKEPLTQKEYDTLHQLYENSAEIQKELRKVQHLVIDNNLRWMDVELALASGEKQADNTIIDGFETVEKNVAAYSESEFGETMATMQKGNGGGEFESLSGEEISEKEAKKIAREFLGIKEDVKISVAENGEGASNGFYSLTIHDPKAENETFMDITKKGGYPIWVLQNREVKDQKVSLNEASNIAEKFLKDHNFTDQVLFESAQYDNEAAFTFVASIDGVRVYPDSIKMKLALDDGRIVGFSARDYLVAHKEREIPEPSISIDEAKKKMNKNVTVMEEHEALIINDIGKEVLCYEFLGTINNDTYRIFINAENGAEEKVEKLKNAEPLYRQL